ncbi:MAG: MFS transporter [Fuerstiella sp.]|nr:MFS transporter [Fuerstiella sp.]
MSDDQTTDPAPGGNPYSQPVASDQAAAAGVAPNAMRLLWAGFWAIFAAGVGFAIRGGIFANWQADYGFTSAQLGLIGGAGFTGFCFGIIIGGVIVDKIGYGKLVVAAFFCHVVSAFVTFGASTPENAYDFLFWGMFVFALANGLLEAVANPLVATLFPNNRTHYLNILHASWPAGLVAGGIAGWLLGESWGWKPQLALYLIPTVAYGIMFMGQKFPRSEASEKGLSLGEMLQDVGILGGAVISYFVALFCKETLGLADPIAYGTGLALLIGIGVLTKGAIGHWLLFVLFCVHALVGAVELGTDQWAQNITGNILSPGEGKILFVWTSAVMFALRFCAHWIEKTLKLSPMGILCICAVLGCIGLNLTSGITAFGGAVAALSVYAIGKTFFWPTMLAVASDRFPRTGAVAISIMGGIGMMSAGLIGSPGLGYFKDRYAAEELAQVDQGLYEEYKSDTPSKFLGFAEVTGLNGTKLGDLKEVEKEQRTEEQATVAAADIRGDRHVLRTDSLIPAAMAGIYLLLLLYFKGIGGYRALTISDDDAEAAEVAAGEFSEA